MRLGASILSILSRIFGAALVGEAASLSCTVEDEPVDVGERGDFHFRAGVGAWRVDYDSVSHEVPPARKT